MRQETIPMLSFLISKKQKSKKDRPLTFLQFEADGDFLQQDDDLVDLCPTGPFCRLFCRWMDAGEP